MSVTTTATSVSYIYQEGEVYSLPYEYQNEADVKASYIDSDGNKVNLAYNVDYTVGGRTVTVIAALPDGVTITFARQTEITQQTELPPQTITKAIETAIDKNTMCIQEIATDQGTLGAEFNAFTANINQTIVRFEQSFDEFKISINQSIVNLEQNFDEFAQTVNQSITNFEQNFNDFKKEVNQTVADAIAEVEAIKETAITEMNDIKDETQNIANNVNVFIPFVNNGTLSWTNEAGLPNPAPVNIKGEQGSPGKDGVDGTDGTAATITIGTVTTGEPGSNASVTNVGTDTASILDISIPRGDKGADGTGAGDVIAAADNTFTATNTFEGVMKTTCDMQHYSTQTGGTLVLGYESDNFQTLIITDSPTEIRYNDTGSNMTGHKKTFIVTIIRKGSAAFKLSPINIVNGQTAYFRIMNGTLLPDIGTGELLKLGLEVDTEFNVIYVHILGGQVAEP
nr:MAG TPA: tail fiber protein [Caudoviricetes sp.]